MDSLTKYYYIVLQSHVQIFPLLNNFKTRMGFLLCALMYRSYAAAQQINLCVFFHLTSWLRALSKKAWGQRGQEWRSEHTDWTRVSQYREILWVFLICQRDITVSPAVLLWVGLPIWYKLLISPSDTTAQQFLRTVTPLFLCSEYALCNLLVRLLYPSSNHLFLHPWRYIIILQKVRLKDLNRLLYQN